MPRVEQQVVIHAPTERVFGVIVDYERYPEFLPELKSVTLLSREDGVALVRFDVELIMRVQYTLRLVEDAPLSVKWTLAEAKMLASNTGSWSLKPISDASCQAAYGLEVKLAGMIPKSVSTRLMGTNLPQMLQRFKARAEALHNASRASDSVVPKGA
jgi:ribosome-associated toxin RatA of RatAB toxin-antitoxin module